MITAIFQTKNWSINTNGIDSQFFKNRKLKFSKQNINKSKTILYAGNLGDGQKLDVFLKDFSNNLPVGWKFLIVGNGSRKKYIVNLINKYKLDNGEKFREVKDAYDFLNSGNPFILHENNS